MKLKDLLKSIYDQPLAESFWDYDISGIYADSRKVEKNGLFVALKGFQYDGTQFISGAITKGARVIVTQSVFADAEKYPGVCFLTVDDVKQFLKGLALNFFGKLSEKIKVIGVTGTNGKTTITHLIEAILHEAGLSCGVIGTVNYRMGQKKMPSANTTPSFLDLQKLLTDMINEGVEYCVMEVSSHALDQGRVDLIDFHTAVFTNLTSDHLDYHQTLDNYFRVKSKLFIDLISSARAVINIDDSYGRKLPSKTHAHVVTYGIKNNADVRAEDIKINIAGTEFKLACIQGETLIRTKLIGNYNIYNILAAIAVCLQEGISIDKIKSAVEHVKNVPGRLESVHCQQEYSILIDYAHTQDALENVLHTLRATTDARIILVFGCGGDRDKTKRPAMGRVAGELADFCIITSDNPRSEEPEAIINDILAGLQTNNYKVIVDREKAIGEALSMARKDDIVLIAGKGHETYQIFKDKTINFDERKVIRQILLC